MKSFLFLLLAACASDPEPKLKWCEADLYVGSSTVPDTSQYSDHPGSLEEFEATLKRGTDLCWEVTCDGNVFDRLCGVDP